jgi:hypothetical protein
MHVIITEVSERKITRKIVKVIMADKFKTC